MSRRKIILWTSVLLACAAVPVGVYGYNYKDEWQGFQYQAWRVGLYQMDRRRALNAFYADPRRAELVLGKSEQELSKRFGRLLPPEEMSEYLKYYVRNGLGKGHKIRAIDDSWFVIVFDNDRAVDLLLVKG